MQRKTTLAGLATSIGLLMAGGAVAATPATAPVAKPAAAKPAAVEPSDKARIEALEARFAAAFNAKDVAKIMACYTRDGLFVFDVSPPRQYLGWAAYKQDWEGLLAGMPGPVTFKLSDLSVTVSGDVAYGHSIQDLHWTANGAASELTVRVTDVYRKIAGKWLIVQEHVSVPVDLASGKPDMLSKP
jgi:uncharacterized protein (TIGR02246 family)